MMSMHLPLFQNVPNFPFAHLFVVFDQLTARLSIWTGVAVMASDADIFAGEEGDVETFGAEAEAHDEHLPGAESDQHQIAVSIADV